MPGGRQMDYVWLHFDRLKAGNTGYKARCRKCHMTMQAIVCRMKRHHDRCKDYTPPDYRTAEHRPKAIPIPITPHSPPVTIETSMGNIDSIPTTSEQFKIYADASTASTSHACSYSTSLIKYPVLSTLQTLQPEYQLPGNIQIQKTPSVSEPSKEKTVNVPVTAVDLTTSKRRAPEQIKHGGIQDEIYHWSKLMASDLRAVSNPLKRRRLMHSISSMILDATEERSTPNYQVYFPVKQMNGL